MPWRKPLPNPITLIDGRVLEILLDARSVLVEEDLGKHPAVRHALELLLKASKTGDATDIQAATRQLMIVLGHRGLIA